jgi:hypothetical protein
MATATILFPVSEVTLPDGSGSGNNPAALATEISSGSQETNSPKVTQEVLAFDAATDEHAMWAFTMPANYGSGGTIKGKVKAASATSGSFVVKAGIAPCEDGTDDDDALVFNTVGTDTVTVPAVQGELVEFEILLTMTNVAAGRKCVLFVGRDADNGSDNGAGDMLMVGTVNLEFVTA